MHVFLVGFMGCGKTTLGKRIANVLKWQFIDLDEFIEKSKNLSVANIFEIHGEDIFRKFEQEALIEISNLKSNVIISTGGGTACFNNNIELMNNSGLTIYLKTGFSILANRLKNSKKKRPLIENLTEPELHAFILKALSAREIYYKKANQHIETNNMDLNEILKIIESNNSSN